MIIIFLPVYNEEGNIDRLLERFSALSRSRDGLRIVIVNDGSVDKSEERIRSFEGSLPITLINHEKNKGVTEAIKTGLREILKFMKDDDILVTMDSDSTHDPILIEEISKKIGEGYDLVNCSRFCRGGSMVKVPAYRLFFSYACRFVLRTLFPIGCIQDYSTFYRGYRGGLIRKAVDFYGDRLFQTHGFVGFPELLIKLSAFKPHPVEIPMVVRYDSKSGASKMNIFKTVRGYLYMVYLLKKQGL